MDAFIQNGTLTKADADGRCCTEALCQCLGLGNGGIGAAGAIRRVFTHDAIEGVDQAVAIGIHQTTGRGAAILELGGDHVLVSHDRPGLATDLQRAGRGSVGIGQCHDELFGGYRCGKLGSRGVIQCVDLGLPDGRRIAVCIGAVDRFDYAIAILMQDVIGAVEFTLDGRDTGVRGAIRDQHFLGVLDCTASNRASRAGRGDPHGRHQVGEAAAWLQFEQIDIIDTVHVVIVMHQSIHGATQAVIDLYVVAFAVFGDGVWRDFVNVRNIIRTVGDDIEVSAQDIRGGGEFADRQLDTIDEHLVDAGPEAGEGRLGDVARAKIQAHRCLVHAGHLHGIGIVEQTVTIEVVDDLAVITALQVVQ
jgi:hypothetical protein